MDKEIQDMLNDLPNKKFSKLSDKQLEFFDKHKKNMVGVNNPMFGKKGKKNPTFGVKKNPDSVERMKKTKKGVPKTEEFKKMVGNVHRGKIVSEETRKRMSLSHIGKPSAIKGIKSTKYKCPHCDIEIGGKGNLIQHINKKHN